MPARERVKRGPFWSWRRAGDAPGLEVTEHITGDVLTCNADITCARGEPKHDPIPRLPIYPTPDDLPQFPRD